MVWEQPENSHGRKYEFSHKCRDQLINRDHVHISIDEIIVKGTGL